MSSPAPSIEVPRPQADKTGRLRRTGPLTLHVIRLDESGRQAVEVNRRLAEENRQLRADVESLKQILEVE